MKERTKRIAAAGIAAVLIAGTAGFTYGQTSAQQAKNIQKENLKETALAVLGEDGTRESGEICKDETVYVKADASGKTRKIIVSEWLKNPGNGEVEDFSELKKIENVKGNEKFVPAGEKDDSSLVWKAEGRDIYYQGRAEKELPVEVKVAYRLDGKEITAQELKGKSGKVEIHVAYENHGRQVAVVNGKPVQMYIPFTMVTGLILPVDEYRNIRVDNGKILSDADKNVVIGVGFPGLNENLRLQGSGISLPEGFTITAEVKKASVGPTMTAASAELLSDFGLEEVGDFSALQNSLGELSNAAERLTAGAEAAADGADRLAEGSGKLYSGIQELRTKSLAMTEGIDELAKGTVKYTGSVAELSAGTDKAADGAAKLRDGILQAKAGIHQAKTGADQLAGGFAGQGTADNPGTASLLKGISTSIGRATASLQKVAAVPASSEAAENAAETVLNQMEEKGIALTDEQKEELKDAVNDAVSEGVKAQTGSQGQVIAEAQRSLAGAGAYVKGLNTLIDSLAQGSRNLQAGLGQLDAGSQNLAGGAEDLVSGTSSLSEGALALNSSGSLLTGGTAELQQGASLLIGGTGQLSQGAGELCKGAGELKKGTAELSGGMTEFKKEGIDRLTKVFGGNIQEVIERIDGMTELGKNYRSFGGIREGMKGNTRFVIETEGIE